MQFPRLTYLLEVKHGLCMWDLFVAHLQNFLWKGIFLISGRLGEPLFVSQTTGLKNFFKAILLTTVQTTPLIGRSFTQQNGQ